MRRGPRLVVVLLFFSTLAAGQNPAPMAQPKTGHAPTGKKQQAQSSPDVDPQRVELLKSSYEAASSLDVVSRAILLEKLCTAAEDVEDLEKSWCKELFQVARDQLDAGNLRAHLETVAARSMSVHYPMSALSMLQEVDVTDAQDDERASMARMVFEGVVHYKGSKAYPELMAAASRLGDSGAYPYLATTILLFGGGQPIEANKSYNHYTETEHDVCNQVLQQGLDYFKKDLGKLRTDFQFMSLLRSASMTGCPSGWMLHQATSDFADELTGIASAAINGDEKVSPHAAKMLYESGQHLLQDIDPVLAESVEKRVGSVKNVPDRPASPGKPLPSPTWDSDSAAHALAAKIGRAEDLLNHRPDGAAPHSPEMENAIREGFISAERLIQKVEEIDPESAKSLRRANAANVAGFVDAALRIWPKAAIAQIQALPDGEFKAHLLITAADSIQRNRERDFVLHRKLQ